MGVARIVSNEEAEAALKNKDNQNIIWKVLKKYRRFLPDDELKSCAKIAVWKTLRKHDAAYKTKFTTSLFRYTSWVVRDRLREEKRLRRGEPLRDELIGASEKAHGEAQVNTEQADSYQDILSKLERLPHDWMKRLLTGYYIYGLSVDEIAERNLYSREVTRKKLKMAVEALKAVCG